MSIFSFVKKKEVKNPTETGYGNTAELANLVLNSIEEGVIIVHPSGVVLLANPAAMRMLGVNDASAIQNVQISSVLRLENGEGMKIEDSINPVFLAMNSGEKYSTRDFVLVNLIEQRKPVAISVVSTNAGQNERIITLRDISRELEEEGEQTEFISTASHEMRTPVASIEGYLGLALNPKTATIDDRARKYLEEAHTSSKHLGRLFKDLLDVTKLDDKKIRVQLSPVEMTSTVRSIANGQVPQMSEKGIHYTFGSNGARSDSNGKVLNQEVYASVDIDFLREAVNNLVENAIKYTAEGGGIWVNVRGDDDRVLINITDTGIGISPDDLKHIFQKFYRADNSQTRTVGGTGLGLYLVKQRVEAMGGKVWAESSFGEGSTFYLSFPRITAEEYQRRKQIASNIEAMSVTKPTSQPVTPTVMTTTTDTTPTTTPATTPSVAAPMSTTTPTTTPSVAAPTPSTTGEATTEAASGQSLTTPQNTITQSTTPSFNPQIFATTEQITTPTAQQPAMVTKQQPAATIYQQPATPNIKQPVTPNTQQPVAPNIQQATASTIQQTTTPNIQQSPIPSVSQNTTPSAPVTAVAPISLSAPVTPTPPITPATHVAPTTPAVPTVSQSPQIPNQPASPSINNFNQVPPINN